MHSYPAEHLDTIALATLRAHVNGSHKFRDPELEAEFRTVREWWLLAGYAENLGLTNAVPKAQAPYAFEWCVSLAKELVRADVARSKGERDDYSLRYTRKWVSECLANLVGRVSDGLVRPPPGPASAEICKSA